MKTYVNTNYIKEIRVFDKTETDDYRYFKEKKIFGIVIRKGGLYRDLILNWAKVDDIDHDMYIKEDGKFFLKPITIVVDHQNVSIKKFFFNTFEEAELKAKEIKNDYNITCMVNTIYMNE